MPDLWFPFSASLSAALVTTIGIYVISHFEAWGRRNSTYLACFAAGVLISLSFTGILAALGMVFLEFPEGIITFLLLISGGGSPKQTLVLAFLTAAVSTPLGTLVSYPMISRIEPSLLGALLSISAGALIFVGATHLLPHAEKEPAKYSLVALAAGILVAAPRHGRSVRCSHRERSLR